MKGLKVPLTRLIETTLPEKLLIKKEDIKPCMKTKKVCSALFFRNNEATNFEMMKIYLKSKR